RRAMSRPKPRAAPVTTATPVSEVVTGDTLPPAGDAVPPASHQPGRRHRELVVPAGGSPRVSAAQLLARSPTALRARSMSSWYCRQAE
ncbi:MAG: hypothetical protein ACRDXB_04425, partial [Actinomycetes bacterium]